MNRGEGVVPFRDCRTCYRIVGDLDKYPQGKFTALALHGIPLSQQRVLPLAKLAEARRPVILNNRIGNGQSDRLDDDSVCHINRFVKQLVTMGEAQAQASLFQESIAGQSGFLLANPPIMLTQNSLKSFYPKFNHFYDSSKEA